MTKELDAAGFVAIDGGGFVVWGIGATADDAIADSIRGARVAGVRGDELTVFAASLRAIPASAALLAEVEAHGGDVRFSVEHASSGRPIAMLLDEVG